MVRQPAAPTRWLSGAPAVPPRATARCVRQGTSRGGRQAHGAASGQESRGGAVVSGTKGARYAIASRPEQEPILPRKRHQ
jgi:hypothetical protein